MIQITQFPIKKSIYYEITTVVMAMNEVSITPFQLTTKVWFGGAKPNP